MPDFTVTVPGVERASIATRSAGAELGAELARLRRDVDAVLSGQWQGAAATAFDRSWGDWHAGAAEVVRALEELADLLADSARGYQGSEDTAASLLRTIA